MDQVIVTATGLNFLQPILDLAEGLLKRPPRKVMAGRLPGMENGYALSIVLLSVVALESFVGRVSYLQSKNPGGRTKRQRESVPAYLASLRRSFRLSKSLTEVFVLRDAIAHGHLWELDVSDHLTRGQILRKRSLLPEYGDKKYHGAINPRTSRSSILGLNLLPRAVGVREVAKVLSIIRRTLTFLAARNLIEPQAFSYRGQFRGGRFDFWDLVDVLEEARKLEPVP